MNGIGKVRMARYIISIIFIFLVLLNTACSNRKSPDTGAEEKTSAVDAFILKEAEPTTIPSATEQTTKEIPSNMEELYPDSEEYKKLKSVKETGLKIAAKGEDYYEATPELSKKMLTMFKNYYEISFESPHGREVGYLDTEDYLYIFRFEGLKDIKVLSNSSFVFIGSDNYFYEDNTLGILLEAFKHMKKQEKNGTRVYVETKGDLQPFYFRNSEKTFDSVKEDVNGDGKKEVLEIYYNGELSLWIDGVKHLFDCYNVLYFVNMLDRKAFSQSTLKPKLNLIPDGSSKGKIIVISYEHRGADNSHEEVYKMKYTADKEFKLLKNDAE